ncbi:hypothetical protein ACW7BJ_33585 [Azospirillum argentinense]
MKKLLLYVLDRAKEPSSWAGFVGIAAGAGIAAPAYTAVTGAIAGVAGLAAFLLKEKATN